MSTMNNNVKIIRLDNREFSIESDSSSPSSTTSSQVDINDLEKDENVAAVNPGIVAAAAVPPAAPADGGAGNDSESDCSECNTTDLLASDPLYFILSRMFITPEGKNIASVLAEINNKLDKLLAGRHT